MALYEVSFTLTGHGVASIEADTLEEAQEKARVFDVINGSDECLEWQYDELRDVVLTEE